MWDIRKMCLDFTATKMTIFCLRQCGHVWIAKSGTSPASNTISLYLPKPKTSSPTSKLYKPTRVNKLTPQKEINSNHKSFPFQLLMGSLLIDAFDKDAKLLLEFSKYPYQICHKIRKIEMVDSWCQLYSLHKDQCF